MGAAAVLWNPDILRTESSITAVPISEAAKDPKRCELPVTSVHSFWINFTKIVSNF